MDIVDVQVHLNQFIPGWQTAEPDRVIEAGLAAMDAVGIAALIIAEGWGFDAQMRPKRGVMLPNGAMRWDYSFSERAVARAPSRFGYVVRVDINDPELQDVVAEVRRKPGVLGIRINPLPDTGEVERFSRGLYRPLFEAAKRTDVPIFAWLPGRAGLLEPYLREYPDVQIILDHCGVGLAPPTTGHFMTSAPATSVTPTLEGRLAQLERVIALAQYPNLALKWSHAPAYLSSQSYPYVDLMPRLRRVLDAFGVERVLWASDCTQDKRETGQTWAQALFYLLDCQMLSETEKAWLLGGAARRLLQWPA